MKTEIGLSFSMTLRGTHHSVFKRGADINVLVANFIERAETHFFLSLVRKSHGHVVGTLSWKFAR